MSMIGWCLRVFHDPRQLGGYEIQHKSTSFMFMAPTTPKSPSVFVVLLLLLECSLWQWTPQCLAKANGGPLTPVMGFSGPVRFSQNKTEEGKPGRLSSSRDANSAARNARPALTVQTFGDYGQCTRPPVRSWSSCVAHLWLLGVICVKCYGNV